jgi:co-chaperonin GroES (HSP10)
MKNESGIHPSLDRVLIRPDEIERRTEGGIIIPETVGELHAMAQSIGTFVDAGPDAYSDYHGPAAKPGDRVAFAKYGGLQVEGKDGKVYRLMNDIDVTAVVEEGVNFTDLKSRKPLSQGR